MLDLDIVKFNCEILIWKAYIPSTTCGREHRLYVMLTYNRDKYKHKHKEMVQWTILSDYCRNGQPHTPSPMS